MLTWKIDSKYSTVFFFIDTGVGQWKLGNKFKTLDSLYTFPINIIKDGCTTTLNVPTEHSD